MIVDHVAIDVVAFQSRLDFLTADPDRRIAMLADERDTKVQLAEGPPVLRCNAQQDLVQPVRRLASDRLRTFTAEKRCRNTVVVRFLI